MENIQNLRVIDPIAEIVLIKMDKVAKRSPIVDIYLIIKEDIIGEENPVDINPPHDIIKIKINV